MTKYTTMKNYQNGHDDGNNDNNAASISVSDSPIHNLITTPRSRGGVSGNDRDGNTATDYCISNLLIDIIYLRVT